MKKEKKVRTYQRRTKSGKTVTVRAHTASYEAAEKAKEAAKKKGAGDEIAERKKKNWELPMDEFLKKLKEERAQKREEEESKRVEDEKTKKSEKKTEKKTPAKKTTKKRTVGTGTNGPEPKKKTTTKKTATKADASEPAFTSAEFKEWYRGTGSDADKKVAKALRKQLGRSGYRKFEDEAIDNYTSRGHLAMFKRVSGGSSTSANTKSSAKGKGSKPTLSKNMNENRSNASAQMKEYKKQLMSAIKNGNSKKIREARKGYMQAMDDSTFGASKASKASAEKDYQSVVKALSKAGYDEQGYKKRQVGTGTNGPEPKIRHDLPKITHGGDMKKDSSAYRRANETLKREGFSIGKDNLYHHKDGRTIRINSKTGYYEETPKPIVKRSKESSSDLRARADKMDADAKRASIVKKVGSNRFKTIKNININVVKPNTRSAQLKGTLYISPDKTKAYYEGSDGKLKKATKSILDRYVNKESKKRSTKAAQSRPEPKLRKGHFASKADAVKSMKEKGYVVDSKGNVKTPFKNGVSTSKGRITKVGDTWTLRHPTR